MEIFDAIRLDTDRRKQHYNVSSQYWPVGTWMSQKVYSKLETCKVKVNNCVHSLTLPPNFYEFLKMVKFVNFYEL